MIETRKEILQHLLEQYRILLRIKILSVLSCPFRKYTWIIDNMNRTGGFSKKQQSSN
jgi:hypothetical protein